jgi:RNA polymerase sigma-70 factor (ECF subfamily)
MERVKQTVKAEQFQIFDLYVLQHWPLKEVTRVLGVSAGQVYLAKHRVSALLKKQARKLAHSAL